MRLAFSFLILNLTLLILLSSCREKPDLERIYSNLEEDSSLNPDTSFIFSSIGLNIREIERSINYQLGNTLLKDDEYINRNGVLMKLQIDRTSDIQLHTADNRLHYLVPVNIRGRVLIDQKILGLTVRAEPGFELSLSLLLSSGIKFGNELKIYTDTRIEQIQWPRKPQIQAGPIRIDLTEALESVIYAYEKNLSQLIQQTIETKIEARKLLSQNVSGIPKFNTINTRDINLWMKLEPLSLIVASKPILRNDSIILKAGISTLMTIVPEMLDSSFIDVRNLSIVSQNDIPDNFEIFLKMNLKYSDLDSLLQKKASEINLEKMDKKIEIRKIRTGKLNNENIYVAADIEGDLEGFLFNSGQIVFDTLNKSLNMKDLKTTFYGSNPIMDFFLSLAMKGVGPKLDNQFEWPLNPLFEKVKIAVLLLFKRLSNKGNVQLELDDLDFDIQAIKPGKDDIEILIRVNGKSSINVSI